uniref:Cytokine receptor common subunit beta N-terminal domain-containing protein n=1 Tax=Phasianus colchicus TaxID=9054 RepID=A0A669Q6R3_PHACC
MSVVTGAFPILTAESLYFLLALTISICKHVPMKSLRCHNDYNSLVTCTWKEHSEAHALLGLTLYIEK